MLMSDHQKSSGSYSAVRAWLVKSSRQWPPRRAKWLKSDGMKDFQRSYRNYRRGHAKGAKGELLDLSSEEYDGLGGDVGGAASPEDIKDLSIFEDMSDPRAIKIQKELDDYRSAYRQFRTGCCKGAEGEVSRIGARFTKDHLQLLPVAALARCLAENASGRYEPPPSTFHIHYGAGKLGLGLVLPAMVKSETPFAIIQRASDAWKSVVESDNDTVDVYCNDTKMTTLQIIRNTNDLIKLDLLEGGEFRFPSRSSSDSPTYRLLVFCPEVEKLIVPYGKSFSCALGPAIQTTLSSLPDILPLNSGLDRPALYACENDHGSVDKLRGPLDAPLYVKECMVDRICSDRSIEAQKICVASEPYAGEIVVSARFQDAIRPGFAGDNVHLPDTAGAYTYLYQRKFLLVNGTHTTLAFMTLRESCEDPSDAPGDFELLLPHNMTPEVQRELKAWCAARCIVLLHRHETEVIKRAHHIKEDSQVVSELWNYAEKTLRRFSTIKDSTKRVLGGGVSNRYQTRLKEIVDTLDTFDITVPLGAKLLTHTGFRSMGDLKGVLQKLLEDCEKFVTSPDEKPKPPPEKENEGKKYKYKDPRHMDPSLYVQSYQFLKGKK